MNTTAMEKTTTAAVTLSVVIPVYNEEPGIPELLLRLRDMKRQLSNITVEFILVDDHSTDGTLALLRKACREEPEFRYLRLARNCGSHVAILAGLENARGACMVYLAADLQDPPELIPQLVQRWREGNHIAWAVREKREGVSRMEKALSALFYFLVNRLGHVALPPQGSDFALLDKRVVNALAESAGAHLSLGGEIARLGFQSTEIYYTKQPRHYGKSKWSLEHKLRAVADAFVAFSYTPLRGMLYLGTLCSLLGFLYAVFVISMRLVAQEPIAGWTSLMVVVLVIGGIQMVMLGVLGEYLWRTLEAARRRPLYVLEDVSSTEKRASMPSRFVTEAKPIPAPTSVEDNVESIH